LAAPLNTQCVDFLTLQGPFNPGKHLVEDKLMTMVLETPKISLSCIAALFIFFVPLVLIGAPLEQSVVF
jgi:hypothetical protein